MNPQKDDTLQPCPYCGQHYRSGVALCPHCQTALDASTSPPVNSPATKKQYGRVMYGPSRVDLDKKETLAEKKHAEIPDEKDLNNTREMYSPPAWREDDANETRVMYGPASYIQDNLDIQKPWFSSWIWIAILLMISTLVWLLLR